MILEKIYLRFLPRTTFIQYLKLDAGQAITNHRNDIEQQVRGVRLVRG